MTDTLDALLSAAGISSTYRDNTGRDREVSEETLHACLAAMGFTEAPEPRRYPSYVVAIADQPPPLALSDETDWTLVPDGATAREGRGPLPALPLGRHELTVDGETVWILSAPQALPLPPRGWGVTLPLYGLRGPDQGGLADYADLATAARAFGAVGAGFLGINPVHAGFGFDPVLISPYSPSHRGFLSTRHIHAPGDTHGESGPLVDYEAALPARRAALETAYRAFLSGRGRSFADFLRFRDSTPRLAAFAQYETLAEIHGPTWDRWPRALHDPESTATRTALDERADRIRFHMWLQFLADLQLREAKEAASAAGMDHGLYLDLAVGTHPHGAETWAERETFAPGVSLGAPPDAFSDAGQNWGLAPFNPRHLIDTGFDALARTLRAQFRHAGMIRIDHILGFARAFWVPNGLPGTYVTMPQDAMFAVARIEAARAGALIVGEDLGNVPDGFREDLADTGILGCEVSLFTPDRAGSTYREPALASFGTHDLPTWAGWRKGRDIDARASIGAVDAGDIAEAKATRATECAALEALTGGPAAADLHAFLARSSARLVALQAEDILGQTDQQNLPGTTSEYPNWRRQLSVGAPDLATDPRILDTGRLMSREGR